MHKLLIIFIICIFIANNSYAILVPVPSIITKTVLASPAAKNIALRVTSAATGAVLGWLIVEGYKLATNKPYFDGNTVRDTNNEILNFNNNVPDTIIKENEVWKLNSVNIEDSNYNRFYFDCNPERPTYSGGYRIVFYSTTIVISSCIDNRYYKQIYYTLSNELVDNYVTDDVVPVDIKYSTNMDTNKDYEIPPYPLYADMGVQGIVDGINTGLSTAGSDVIVNRDDVLPIIPHLPTNIVEDIKNNSSALDEAMIENAINNISENVIETEISIPISDFEIPEVPLFDTSLDLPEQVDFMNPVRNFLNNVLNSVPFISMFQNTNIEINNPQNIVTFNIFGNTLNVNFAEWTSIYNFMSTIIIFCASVFAIFILVV